MKKVVIIFAVIIVVLLGILIFVNPAKGPELPPGSPASGSVPGGVTTSSTTAADEHLQISTLHANDLITSPVSVAGTVTGGGWFFEASFPVKVVDADGTVLGQGPAQAQSDWMSTGTVPFKAKITFKAPHSATGIIVFSKDNPSGLPQNDQSLSIPIRFASMTTTTGFKYDSGVTGVITLGPTCPVERIPPDPACAPKPYPTRIVVYQKNTTTIAASAAPDETGFYNIVLQPGSYSLSPQGGNPLPRCTPVDITIVAHTFQKLDLQCDTGIR